MSPTPWGAMPWPIPREIVMRASGWPSVSPHAGFGTGRASSRRAHTHLPPPFPATLVGAVVVPVHHIHAYLVHPEKGSETPTEIRGTAVSLKGKLFTLLNDTYFRADHECDVDITFDASSDGKQFNPCRELITAY